jgi:Mg-chelatase subunit ChlD/pimeloyl-ACP methyl ester carboxylesterase
MAIVVMSLAFVAIVLRTEPACAVDRLPVLLVHGVSSSKECWTKVDNVSKSRDFREWASPTGLQQLGEGPLGRNYDLYSVGRSEMFPDSRVYIFDYSDHVGATGDIVATGAMLSEALEEVKADSGEEQVYLVGHSMGGLVTRSYMQGLSAEERKTRGYGDDIAGLVTLDTPHLGCELGTRGVGAAVTLTRGYAGLQMTSLLSLLGARVYAPGLFLDKINSPKRPLPDDGAQYRAVIGTYFWPDSDGVLYAQEQRGPESGVLAGRSIETKYEDLIHASNMNWFGVGNNLGGGLQVPKVLTTALTPMESPAIQGWVRDQYSQANEGYTQAHPAADATSLVIDVSTSMDDEFDGSTKLAGAKNAARAVLDVIKGYSEYSGTKPRVALSTFSDGAESVLGLSANPDAAQTAVGSLGTHGNTDMRAGLAIGIDEALKSAAADRVVFFLSDGVDTSSNSRESILAEAERASAAGIRIYTIGFGDPGQIDEDLLREIASTTGAEYSHADPSVALSLIASFIKAEKARKSAELLWEWFSSVGQGKTVSGTPFSLPAGRGVLEMVLAWPGSTLECRLTDPSGNAVREGYPGLQSVTTSRTSQLFIENAQPGEWKVDVYGAETSMAEEPFYALASFRETTDTVTATPTVGGGAPAGGGAEVLLLFVGLALAGGVGWAVVGRRGAQPAETAPADVAAVSSASDFLLVDAQGSALALKEGPNVVGRDSASDIVVADSSVSRQHALIVVQGRSLSVKDLGSAGGTFVNDAKTDNSTMRADDHVRFGAAEFTVAAKA